MSVFPGSVISFAIETRAAGVLTAPAATPVARVWLNGVDTAAATVTMLTTSAGRVSYTVPSNATIGSWYVLSVTATVGGVTDTVYSDPFEVVPLVAGLVVPLRSTAGEERLLPGKVTVKKVRQGDAPNTRAAS
jgi:hypothetical protein